MFKPILPFISCIWYEGELFLYYPAFLSYLIFVNNKAEREDQSIFSKPPISKQELGDWVLTQA